MAERYFLILVVALTVAGSLWLSFVNPLISYGIFLASLLALLGITAAANAQKAGKAAVLMPLFFAAAIAYEVYLYINGRFGYILVSILLLSLVGLILGFRVSSRQKPAKPVYKQAGLAAPAFSAAQPKSLKKKAAKKKGSRRKK